MNKFKNILGLLVLSILALYSCGDNNNGFVVDNFDHEAQALIDNDSLTQFLKNYYFDTSVDSIKPLVSGKTALYNELGGNLKELSVTESEVDYKLYVYVIDEGGKDSNGNVINDKGFPTTVDSILVKYYGQSIVRTDSISKNSFDNSSNLWITLDNTIRGWSHGFSLFRGGKNVTNNGPITFENGGKGFLIIPSGLAYRNTGSSDGSILSNQNLLFYINLLDLIKDTDHDNDGKPSIQEDADGDGDPRNDFSDDNLPTTPDYLNPNIK